MPAHIQALDLPEIMDIIGHHLSKGTLLNCIQVNRSWHDYFVPILWKSFIFSAYSSQPQPPVETLLKYAHYIRQLEFSGLIPPWYMSIGCKNLDFLKVVGERFVLEDSSEDPLTSLIQENPGLQRLILFDVGPHPEEMFWDAVAGLTELKSLIVNRIEVPPQSTHAFFRAISAYTPTLRLDKVYFKRIRLEYEEENGEEEEEGGQVQEGEGLEQQHESGEETMRTGGNGAQGQEDTTSDNDDDTNNTHDYNTVTSFFYAPEVPPGVTFSRLKTLYMFDLTGTGYDKQLWILENAPRLEHLSWRGGYDFEFPTESFISALESGHLSRLESLELRGSHLKDPEIAQILSHMNRLVKLVAPRTELGPLAMKQLFQHYETVRELDISGCENVRSWMIQMFLCKFASLELRKLSLDFEFGYVDKEKGVVEEEEEEEEEESDDDEDENWADVAAGEDGDNETAEAEVKAEAAELETGADGIGGAEEETATKDAEVTKVEEAIITEADVEQIVVEMATAEGEKIEELEETASGVEDATVGGVAITSETTRDVVAIAQVDEQEPAAIEVAGAEGEEVQEEEDTATVFTPEEIAAAMAAAQWDQQQIEADTADAEAEENPDDLWKNLVPYVHSEERQRIIFERLGQLKYLEELNIKQQTERPYSAAEQLRAGVVQKVLDLSLKNGMDLLSGLSRLREFYFPGPQEMGEREVLWIIEHWGGSQMTYMFSFSASARKKPASSSTKHTTIHMTTTKPGTTTTTAVALPMQLPEILYIIFSYLSEHTIRHSIRFVCKQWLAISRPFVQASALWKDRTINGYKHGFILNHLHHVTILRVLFEQTWQLKNTQFAWGELVEKIDTLKDKGQLRIWKLELNGGNFLESRIYTILPRITTLTHLRIERVVQQVVHVGVILAVAPHLKKLHIEGTKAQQSHANQCRRLVNLTIKWMSIDQSTLESIVAQCPQLVTLRLVELGQASSQVEPFDRSSLFTLVSSACPFMSWFHLSFEGQSMSREESIAYTETFDPQPAKESITAIKARIQQRPASRRVMSILSNDIRPETHLQLFRTQTVNVNTITTLEICLGNGLLLSRYVSHTLHDILCSSPWLQHLIAPMIPYYAEYFDLEGPVDPVSGSYHPRQCRLGKPPMDLFRTRKRIWACRGLKTLRIQIDSMDTDHASEENARIMFGYLVRVCPDLQELSIRRRQLNLNLAGGLCLLTRLRKLERLMIWTDTWTKFSKKDLEWMARVPKKKSMEQWVLGLATGSRSPKRGGSEDRQYFQQYDLNGKSRPGMAARTLSSVSTSSSSSTESRSDTERGGGSSGENDTETPLTIEDMKAVGTMADIEAWEREQESIKRRKSGSSRGIGRLSSHNRRTLKEEKRQGQRRDTLDQEDEGICWPKLEFLGLQLVMVHKEQPLKLEEHLPAMIAKIRPETKFSCEASRWHEMN
ncbi:hypothetical protein BG015_001064 [Linnemannia schmuckeri]|uniref:F-box domain-containing protein n=1 Tax=Linnemannia schmuckeri TaxID=64567 RepID=A0A9P5V761_9FUNG|nr:hypothetical protein BG015_001064 [Linnemannia schmuckeri]